MIWHLPARREIGGTRHALGTLTKEALDLRYKTEVRADDVPAQRLRAWEMSLAPRAFKLSDHLVVLPQRVVGVGDREREAARHRDGKEVVFCFVR
eukprot:8650590-Pyramimonas_sp.AAC.1